MLITCCTDTYFEWGELFLRSFKLTNDNNIPIHINGVRLTSDHIEKFKSIYPNITIVNRQYNDEDVAKKYGVTLDDVVKCRDAVSKGFKHGCRWWMDFIVVDGRISWLHKTLLENKDRDWWLHIDIDLMFRDTIQPLIDKMMKNDVVCRFRPDRTFVKKNNKKPTDDMKIAGGMVGLRGEKGIDFVRKWVEFINSKTHKDFNEPNIKGRNQGWGQTTLYYAYDHFKEAYNWGEIEAKWLTASCNMNNPIWAGHKKGKVVYRGEKRSIGNRHLFRDIFFEELELMERENGTSKTE